MGIRVDDEHDPRHVRATAGAAMLLEVAGVTQDNPEVQRWFEVGRERRDRNRTRPRYGW